MSAPTSANYVFLPWVRQGAASSIQTPDSLTANQAGAVSVAVTLRVNDTPDIQRRVRLHGPGDVTGIDPHQVVRTEPRPRATDFEPNYFPAIEFDRPDFPWLFTPARAQNAGRLRPWLCLVVIRQQEGVTVRVDRSLPLPVLEIRAPAKPERELPDLAEAWAWAHAQVTGSTADPAALKRSLGGDPALTVSRLLCPRRLDPMTAYIACVVPTFELGRKAGLGLSIDPSDEQELRPAWTSGSASPAQVTVPVYFHWEFQTGAGGDFEELVRRLEPRDARDMPLVGTRLMDISTPGFDIVPRLPAGTAIGLEGALRVLNAAPQGWPDETRGPFQAALKQILDAPWHAKTEEGHDPLLAPPIYGCWPAARHTIEIASRPDAAAWLDELNLDPRHRAVAAIGTAVVQAQQEQLMAAAWEQSGEIQRINQMRRQAQLGRAVNAVYHARHFGRFSPETLLKVVAPAQSRLVVPGGAGVPSAMLLSRAVAQSSVPARAVSAPLRRLTSPRGVIRHRFLAPDAPPIALAATFSRAVIDASTPIPGGLVTLDQVSDQLGLGGMANYETGLTLSKAIVYGRALVALDNAPRLGDFAIEPEGTEPKRTLFTYKPEVPGNQNIREELFRNAAKAHFAHLAQLFAPRSASLVLPMNLFDTNVDLKTRLLQSMDPDRAIEIRVGASLRIAGDAVPRFDPLEPILDAPDFPQPMYEAVRDISQDFILPGLEHVPPNTVTLLETNPHFVESVLVGLNTEMSRELLWRNYPTDQRGTCFRRFWDRPGGDGQPDIDMIHTWGNRRLGGNARADEQLVLLIRGELLRRYPNAVIYAVAAALRDDRLELSPKPEDERPPLFRGTLRPDVTFLGFPLTREDAVADPGWFFVIQEQPTEPRFGLDVATFDGPLPPLTGWDQLSWRHVAGTEDELKALSHASIRTRLPDVDRAKWGRNSAHQACITLQRPVRIAIHARDILQPASR